MCTYLKTRSFINPRPSYVENKVPFPKALRLDEIARVFMRLDHIASRIVNANLSIV